MNKGKFTFMESYLETVKQLKEYNPELASRLLEAIVEYGLYWTEPEDPLLRSLLVQIKYAIDSWKEISQKNSENGKKGWRPKKSETESKTSETETNENEENPKKANESEWKQKENKNKKEKENKKINNNNLKVISDTEIVEKEEYGNTEINLLIDLIKSFNWWIIDWTIKEQRQYGYLLLQKLKKLPSVEEWKFKRNEVLETILRIISQSKYHSWKIVSTEKIFRNLTLLMQECKKEFHKAEVNSLVITTI